MENIITIEEFDPKNIVLNLPTQNTHGGSVIPIHYQCPRRGKIPFILKPPKCELPYGTSQFPTADKVIKGKEKEVNYSLNLSFSGFDDKFSKNSKVGMFYDKLKKMEKHIHKELVANSQKYLKDDIKSVSVIEKMCWPIVKHSKDKDTGKVTNKYPPTFSVKLPRYGKDGAEPRFSTKVTNSNGENVTLTTSNVHETFPRNSEVRCLIQCSSIQKVAKLSMSFKALQIKTYPGKNQISGNVFENDSDDETPVKSKAKNDSDDEEVEETPVKSKAKAKKDSEEEVEEKEEANESEEVEVEVEDSEESE